MAMDYLLGLDASGVTQELLDKYLHLSKNAIRPSSLSGIYQWLLVSAQNANMRAGVIGGALGGVENLGLVLCDFEPLMVLRKFPDGWEQILDEIEKTLNPTGLIRRTPRSIWPKYCQTILSAAQFLEQFSTVDEFYNWVDHFDKDELTRAALPLIIETEIAGIGFSLACDFLKELGNINFAKPDVHLREIFIALKLCSSNAGDYEVFKAVIRIAKNCEVTPYNVDKLFWLIGSGYFNEDKQIGKNGRIGSHKADFIEYAQNRLLT